MPQRKVLRTVVLHRETGRVVPTLGEIFDFTQEELTSINNIDPEALGRPLIEADLEDGTGQPKPDAPATIVDPKTVVGEKAKGKAKVPADDDDI